MTAAVKISESDESGTITLIVDGEEFRFPLILGTEGEKGIDISTLRKKTGLVTIDEGFVNTASCSSAITFLDGENGILRYRGYPIEDLAKEQDFLDTCYLVINGDKPDASESLRFKDRVASHSSSVEGVKQLIKSFPNDAHPMGVLSSVVLGCAAYYPEFVGSDLEVDSYENAFCHLIAQVKNFAAFQFRSSQGLNLVKSKFGELDYASDFAYMMFEKEPSESVSNALNTLFILHAEHEQNCSTSAVRLVGSSKANIYASISSGINALWGPLHGGANQAVIEMLEGIHQDGGDYRRYLSRAKDKNDPFRLMGFGHRVYKNFDPRARIIKKVCDDLLAELGMNDPLLDLAKGLEEEALKDEYFVTRNLYPNVDFYSGIIYKALGIPTSMFTVMFALGRLPGWLAQWKEMRTSDQFRIGRPRQIYKGYVQR